jgi:hypothetical protein
MPRSFGPPSPPDSSRDDDSVGSDLSQLTADEPAGYQPPPNSVSLKKAWCDRYTNGADGWRQQALKAELPSPDGDEARFCVAFVGEAGVGKGCVINHIVDSLDAAQSGDVGGCMGMCVAYSFPCRLLAWGWSLGLGTWTGFARSAAHKVQVAVTNSNDFVSPNVTPYLLCW